MGACGSSWQRPPFAFVSPWRRGCCRAHEQTAAARAQTSSTKEQLAAAQKQQEGTAAELEKTQVRQGGHVTHWCSMLFVRPAPLVVCARCARCARADVTTVRRGVSRWCVPLVCPVGLSRWCVPTATTAVVPASDRGHAGCAARHPHPHHQRRVFRRRRVGGDRAVSATVWTVTVRQQPRAAAVGQARRGHRGFNEGQ